MNAGKQFETQIKESIPPNVYYYRIKDSASSWNSNDENNKSRFTPKNEFDTILYKNPIMFLLELKSTSGTSISFSGTSPMIKKHQIDELTKASQYDGILAGFILNYRKIPNTYFLNIIDFNKFVSNTTKSSINETDIKNHNGYKIEAILKRVKYKYRIDLFLEHFILLNKNEKRLLV